MTIRVLLADDHALIREGLKAVLEARGDVSVVEEADNGYDAVRRAQASKPDVVFMDIAMPRLNGIEATRELREKLPETRVVILSMHFDAEFVHQALAAGAAGYVLKESASREVVAALHTVHAGREYLSPAVAPVAGIARGFSRSPIECLAARERQVLQLVAEGWSSAEIGQLLHLSRKTVETYRTRLKTKLGVGDVPSLVKFAIEHGITPLAARAADSA